MVSDRQWRDVISVPKVQGRRLDESYLAAWATKTGVEDMFAQALVEVQSGQ